jgi:hypothetical protein
MSDQSLSRWLTLSYFFLLVSEGALRKWFLPQLATPLLLVRDPIAIAMLAHGLIRGYFPEWVLWFSGVFTLVSVVLGSSFGHGNLFVIAAGVRSNILHVFVIFYIASTLNKKDYIYIIKTMLILSVPMAILASMQHNLPKTHIVNIGSGGVGTTAFDAPGAPGKNRPSGTFSFISGIICFYSFVSAIVLANWSAIRKWKSRHFLFLVATVGLLIGLAVSVSRSLILNVSMIFIVFLIFQGARYGVKRVVAVVGPLALVALVAYQSNTIKDGFDAFSGRWESSVVDRGGVGETLIPRLADALLGPPYEQIDHPIVGMGTGAGTQIGAVILTGERGFLAGEAESYRIVNTLGVPLGWCYIAFRWFLALTVVVITAKVAWRVQVAAPILLSVSAFSFLTIGQWGQPTTQGFGCFVAGLSLGVVRLLVRRQKDKFPGERRSMKERIS